MSRKKGRHEGLTKAGHGAQSERRPVIALEPGDPVEVLIARARKSRARGDVRRGLVLLREACALDEWRARTWTILGTRLVELGHTDEAMQAFKQARWLRLRAGERARVHAMDRLIARLLPVAA
jgi:Flp pilus assembly protein TadD